MAQIINLENWSPAAKVGLVQTVRTVGNDGAPRSVLSEYKRCGEFDRAVKGGIVIGMISILMSIGGAAVVIRLIAR